MVSIRKRTRPRVGGVAELDPLHLLCFRNGKEDLLLAFFGSEAGVRQVYLDHADEIHSDWAEKRFGGQDA